MPGKTPNPAAAMKSLRHRTPANRLSSQIKNQRASKNKTDCIQSLRALG